MALDFRGLGIPSVVADYLSTRGASRTGVHASADATAALLTGRRYPAHRAVLEFEEVFGGLELREPEMADPTLVFGPYACFSATPPWTGREEDLVPVIFASNDVVYLLDAAGRGWTCSTMAGGGSRPSADDGHALFAQAVLWRMLERHPGSYDVKTGRHGAKSAKRAGAVAITGASGPSERWWGDEKQLIVEIDHGNGYTEPTTYSTL